MKRGRKVDDSRDLCPSCVKREKCVNIEFETGENGNVFSCSFHKKANTNKLKWRADIGEEFYCIILRDEKNSMKDYMQHKRVEANSRIDSLYHEVGNYFKTSEDCEIEIIRWNKL